MTDGSRNYNGVKDRVIDPVHRTRTELKHDPKFREMKKELTEAAAATLGRSTETCPTKQLDGASPIDPRRIAVLALEAR